MAAGTKWVLPGGHNAIEIEGSTVDVLRVCIIADGWHWLKPPQDVARCLCTLAPMKYYNGKTDQSDGNCR